MIKRPKDGAHHLERGTTGQNVNFLFVVWTTPSGTAGHCHNLAVYLCRRMAQKLHKGGKNLHHSKAP